MLRRIGIGIIGLFVALSIIPYLIPVTGASEVQVHPFENSAYAPLNGLTIHYRVWREDIPPKAKVLLIHGLGGSTFSWRENIDALLDAGCLVVAADLPGFGYSGRNRAIDHAQENRSRLLWHLLHQLDEEYVYKDSSSGEEQGKGWILVGHSMGAGTVTAMALHNPRNTNALIYVSPALLTGGNRGGSLITKYPPLVRWLEVLGRYVFLNEKRISSLLMSAYGRTPNPAELQGYLEPLRLPGTASTLAGLVKTSTPTSITALEQLTLPVGAIWGELDSWIPAGDAEQLREIVPQLELRLIPHAHHCPMETDAAAFNAYLLELIRFY